MGTKNNKPPQRTLLEEIEDCLAQSLLVFLMADMRLMSATGRIGTKYETIAIDSDVTTRDTAAKLAGLPDETDFASNNEGLSPAQIMAVLLIELQKTVEARRKAQRGDITNSAAAQLENQQQEHDTFLGFSTALKKSSRFEDDMHSLLKAYAQMIGRDLNSEVPHIQARRSVYNLAVDYDDDLEDIAEEEKEEKEEGDDKEEGEGNQRADEGDEGLTDRIKNINPITQSRIQRANPVTGSRLQRAKTFALRQNELEKTNQQLEEVTDVLFQMGETNTNVRQSVMASGAGVGGMMSLSKEELIKVMERAAESRVYGKLDFMSEFFREGTVSQLMVKSEVKVVWMNDWYPVKDLTYAIAVDEVKKRILVMFRGAITRTDWSHALDADLRKVKNPITESFDGKSDLISVYSGFYQYLFRTRLDTKTRKFDEIANLSHKYGMERIGPDYTLLVTGHSLGAALSTVYSFYASADERFTKNGPIKVFTFGSPYVGGRAFAHSFRHQEETGKIQYARFFNHNDLVAHLPANMNIGGKYEHVGIGVKLPRVPRYFAFIRKWRPDVFYVKDEGFCSRYTRAIKNNFLLHLPLPWRIAKMHTLDELQKRLMYGSAQKDAAGNFELLEKPLEELYELFLEKNP